MIGRRRLCLTIEALYCWVCEGRRLFTVIDGEISMKRPVAEEILQHVKALDGPLNAAIQAIGAAVPGFGISRCSCGFRGSITTAKLGCITTTSGIAMTQPREGIASQIHSCRRTGSCRMSGRFRNPEAWHRSWTYRRSIEDTRFPCGLSLGPLRGEVRIGPVRPMQVLRRMRQSNLVLGCREAQ